MFWLYKTLSLTKSYVFTADIGDIINITFMEIPFTVSKDGAFLNHCSFVEAFDFE